VRIRCPIPHEKRPESCQECGQFDGGECLLTAEPSLLERLSAIDEYRQPSVTMVGGWNHEEGEA